MIEEHPNVTKIRKALRLEGGFYEFEDVLKAIETGMMQSFSEGDSVVFTRVQQYPRRKVLELTLIFGSFVELKKIEPRLIEFAKGQGCDALVGCGRLGWQELMTEGWRRTYSSYIKEIAA